MMLPRHPLMWALCGGALLATVWLGATAGGSAWAAGPDGSSLTKAKESARASASRTLRGVSRRLDFWDDAAKPENAADSPYLQTVQSPYYNIGVRVLQILIGICYYYTIASKYPKLQAFNDESSEIQRKNEISATFETTCATCLNSFCCPSARAAHTMDATGTLGYWPALCLMIFCPFCTLCYANAFTDMNEKLGGERRGCFMSFLCTWFCSCCVIAQDADSLDAATGCTTKICSFEEGGDSSSAD